MKTIIILTTTFVTLAALAFAAVPQTINYQGYLKNAATGTPASGPVSMTFSLYSSATPRNNPVWVEPAKPVTVTNGIYSTTVGSTANPITAPFDVPYYLGITVNGTELPLQSLSSVPYAQRAAVADAVPASAISAGSLTGTMLADGTITAGKLAPGVVPSWQNITTATTAVANSGYVTSGATPVEVTLPASAAVGDTVSITGAGAGGWTVTANGSQTILSSTSGVLETGAVWAPQPASGARTWTSIASSSDGSKLAAAPYDGQIHTSTDAGVTWTARGLANSWMSIASSTDGVKLVAVAQNNKIYTSDDSGVSWTERNYLGNWRSVTSSADGTKLAAVTFVTAIYTSSDSGATWTNQPATAGLQWLSIASSADGRKLIAGTGGGAGQLYTSSDSGVTWTAQASPIGKEYRAVASSVDGVKLVAVAQGGQIYTSGDSGVTWTARESSRQWFAVTSSADGSRLAATLIPGQIYTSSDSGITWAARESSRQWSAVASSADGTRLAAADLNGIIYTSRGSFGTTAAGTFWTPQPVSGARTWTSIASSSDGSKLAAAPYDGQIHTSTDAGVTWTARGLANSWMSIASSTDGVKLVAVAQNNKIYTSDDSGVSWTERNYLGNWRSVTSSADGTRLAAVTFVTAIYTSSDSGATWTNQPATAGLQWLSIASSADGRKLIAGTGGGAGQLYTSSDSGVTWTAQASPIGKEYRAVASSADGVKLVAVAQGGQIYTSGDSGVTWTARESSRQWFAVTSSADGSRLAATLIPGQIYTSSDSGITWTARESSRQWSAVASSADGTRLAAADLNGIIYTSVEGVIDSIIGGPRDNIQLQYVGNNQYQLLSYQPATAATASGIADGSITTAKLADGAVTDAKITGQISGSKISSTGLTAANFAGTLSGDVTGTQSATTVAKIQGRAVYPTTPVTDDVLRYNADFAAWVPIAAITGVTAGAGITGGGVYGDVTLNADFAAAVGDGGVATTVARGDHVHDTRYFTKTELQGNGTINTPSNPVDWSKLTNVPERVVNGPRFAMSETDNNTTVIGAACTNYLSVQITVPGPGAIAVEATNRSRISHAYGIEDLPSIHIGSSPTDCADLPGSWMQSIPASLNAVNPIEQTAAPRRAFTVPAAGTYTYYLNGFMAIGQDAEDRFWYARMFATYYPN